MYDNKLWVFENIINLDLQEKIKNTLLDNDFPWYFIKDITDANRENSKQLRPGFQHLFWRNFQQTSENCHLVKPILDNACDKIGFDYSRVMMGRAFLQEPLNLPEDEPRHDTAHIDSKKRHLVVLYSAIDSDGDTVVFNEKTVPENKRMTVQKKITPKQGNAIVFDGSYWHTAEQPKYNNRLMINFNLI